MVTFNLPIMNASMKGMQLNMPIAVQRKGWDQMELKTFSSTVQEIRWGRDWGKRRGPGTESSGTRTSGGLEEEIGQRKTQRTLWGKERKTRTQTSKAKRKQNTNRQASEAGLQEMAVISCSWVWRQVISKQPLSQDCVVVTQLLSHVWLFATPWTAAHQASLSFTISNMCWIAKPEPIDSLKNMRQGLPWWPW